MANIIGGTIIQDIFPEALFEELVLLQEDVIRDTKQLYEVAVETAKDRQTPEFFTKISNVVEVVVKVFGERDACLREYSSYHESPYWKNNSASTFELVAARLNEFVLEGRKESEMVKAVVAKRKLYLATLISALDRYERVDGVSVILEFALDRVKRYYSSFLDHHRTAYQLGTTLQQEVWGNEATAIGTRCQNFIVSSMNLLSTTTGFIKPHPATAAPVPSLPLASNPSLANLKPSAAQTTQVEFRSLFFKSQWIEPKRHLNHRSLSAKNVCHRLVARRRPVGCSNIFHRTNRIRAVRRLDGKSTLINFPRKWLFLQFRRILANVDTLAPSSWSVVKRTKTSQGSDGRETEDGGARLKRLIQLILDTPTMSERH